MQSSKGSRIPGISSSDHPRRSRPQRPPRPSIIGLTAIIVAAAGALSGCTYHQIDVAAAGQPRGLTVSGTGRLTAEPDMASVRIGVETRHSDAKVAVEENNRRMTLVVANVKGLGLPEADLQSANFSIHYEVNHREPPPPRKAPLEETVEQAATEGPTLRPPAPPPQRGEFVVNNTLVVLVRDLALLSDVLGTATSVGANSISGVDFEIDDSSALQAQARDAAIADAMQKAERLAKAAGTPLGRLVRLEEGGGGAHPMSETMFRMSAAKSSVPIQSGTMEVTESVTLTFELTAPKPATADEK